MKKVLYLLACILVSVSFFPRNVFAHVKWFTEVPPERVEIEAVITPLFMVMTIVSAVCIGLLLVVMSHYENSSKLKRLQEHSFNADFTNFFLQYGVAFALLIQLLNQTLFAPEFTAPTTIISIIAYIVVLLYLIPSQITAKIASSLLLLLYTIYLVEYGLFHMLDYLFYLGVIGYFLCLRTSWERLKSPILFISTGFSLCWLAAEKWIYPGMTINIIELYGVPTMGFDPYIFTVLAAFVEFCIGVAWMTGILNRFFAFVFTGVMAVTTLFFGFVELVGHFLIFILMIIFIAQNETMKGLPKILFRTLRAQALFISCNFIFILSTFVLIYYRFA